MDEKQEKELRGRLAAAESLGEAIRNNEIDALLGHEKVLVLRLLEAEKQLQLSEQRLRTAVEGARLGTFELDLQQQEFTHSDERMTELYGFCLKETVPLDEALSRVHPDDLSGLREALQEAAQAGSFEHQHRVCRPDGEESWIQLNGRLAQLQGGHGPLLVGVASDITVHKTRETSLTLAAREEAAANQRKSDFISNLSHEVRTPLTGILGFADILTAEQDPELLREGAESIRENGKMLLSIINNVLDLSKLEAGKASLHPREVDPRELVAQVCGLMEGAAQVKDLALRTDCADDLPSTFTTDPDRLKQVLINLLSNAIKFTESGHVCLCVSVDGQSGLLRFAVTDTGPGVAPAFQEKLFEAFEQGAQSDGDREPGTGLGLAISREIVGVLGGGIELSRTGPEGSTFSVLLPLPPESAATTASVQPRNEIPLPEDLDEALRERHILVVEDKKSLRSLLTHTLRRYGCEPVLACSGEEALQYAEDQVKDLDAVLLDMRLPGMDGLAVAREMRKRGMQQPIIALTAHAGSMGEAACYEAGCTHFMLKPFRQDALLQALLNDG